MIGLGIVEAILFFAAGWYLRGKFNPANKA